MCQLQVRDEVLTVNGLLVAQMSYKQWKSSLEEALQKGSLVMDVRRHGQHSESYPLCGCVFDCCDGKETEHEGKVQGLLSWTDTAA